MGRKILTFRKVKKQQAEWEPGALEQVLDLLCLHFYQELFEVRIKEIFIWLEFHIMSIAHVSCVSFARTDRMRTVWKVQKLNTDCN